MTNQHVVEGAASIAAININGAIFLFERVVAQPAGVDLAVLKFRASDVPFLTLGKSTTAVEGQKVIVIGNPTGLTGTVSDGIISAFRENRSLIQITAPISHGSSGSPVMDEDGQVIGVATLVSAEGQNLNFAIAVEKVSAALIQPLPEQPSSQALPTTTAKPDQGGAPWDEGPSAPPAPTPTPYRLMPNAPVPTLPSVQFPVPRTIEAKVYFYRGLVSMGRKDYDKAISDFDEAIRLDPNYTLAYCNRGNTYSDHGYFDKAISDYNEAIRLDPNYTLAYYDRGNAYYRHGNLDKAISDYSEAIRLDPKYAPAYNNRGNAYADHGNLDKAISDYNEAIRLDPKYAPAYYNRGTAYLRTGNRAKANADFAKAKRIKSQ